MDYRIDNIGEIFIGMKRLGCSCIIDFMVRVHVPDKIMEHVVISALLFDQNKWIHGLPVHSPSCTSSDPVTFGTMDVLRFSAPPILGAPQSGENIFVSSPKICNPETDVVHTYLHQPKKTTKPVRKRRRGTPVKKTPPKARRSQ